MPDFPLCHGNGCPSKNQCYRFRAIPHPDQQSYAAYDEDRYPAADRCTFFWDATEYVSKNLKPIECPLVEAE